MQSPLNFTTDILYPGGESPRTIDMTGRCAVAVCLEGDFDIRIMSMVHRVESRGVLLCMPFVNVELMDVRVASKVIFGGIDLENIMAIINRTVATHNLLAIRQHPVVMASEGQLRYIKSSVDGYLEELSEWESSEGEDACSLIIREIINARTQLIVAQVLKLYFTNMPMEVRGHSHTDMVFQQFMLDLYSNFRNQRNVAFYALRSGLSLKYFSTLIHKLSGASPSEWIEMAVTGEAKGMLSDPSLSIKEVSAALNFPDAPTFTKYFRRVTGLSPRQYRLSIG